MRIKIKAQHIVPIFLLVILLMLQITEWKVSYIATNSMEPSLLPGDLIVAAPITKDKIQTGDIIIYTNAYKKQICHRVIGSSAAGNDIITKGDANCIADPPIKTNQPLRIVRVRIPFAGYPFVFLQDKYFLTALLLSFGCFFFITKSIKQRSKTWMI